jgi:hypothetical protein
MMSEQSSPDEQVRRLFGDAEKRTSAAFEQVVQSDSFGEILARTTENVMAVTKIGFGFADMVVRNLRLAGRGDIARLGRQLARTEDKLERVLQEVEELRDEVRRERTTTRRRASSSGSGGSSSSSRSNGSSRRRSSNTKAKSS